VALEFTWDPKKAAQPVAREENMKKVASRAERDTLRPEYDFSRGVRGKYYKRFRAGTNIVVLEPDVALAFRDSATVNRLLRALLETMPRPRRTSKRRSA